MIYDDQPQMLSAAFECPASGWRDVLAASFAAIDREALIDKMFYRARAWGPEVHRRQIEAMLVAAGVIPERGQ